MRLFGPGPVDARLIVWGLVVCLLVAVVAAFFLGGVVL